MNIEHWFPEAEASEPIIEHIHAHVLEPNLLRHAFRVRNEIVTEIESLDKERDELEESIPLATSKPVRSGLPAIPTPECDETDRRKKRRSEELEDREEELGQRPHDQGCIDFNDQVQANEHGGRVDYREDYGPEVPVTRDGKIDPDWHRDKIVKFDRTKAR